ncbi:MAG: glutathione peroxidase [Myxococcales bacterium]|nr:MAG: glutathione peroxidase [Myxococcales bacterium]
MNNAMEGKEVPEVTFRVKNEKGEWQDLKSKEIFSGKTVAVFSLPGAFTPTCSTAHVPRYNELAPVFKEHGVDDIVCVSVNDTFVMNAWKHDQGADRVRFIPDGNGEFTKAMGMLVDKRELGFGPRSWRYSMLVKNGKIEKMFVEPEVPGDPYKVSDADTMLNYIAPNASKTKDVLLFTKPGCSFCTKAKAMLKEKGWEYSEVTASPRMLRAVSEKATTPQVFIDGKYIGDSVALEAYLKNN